MSTTPPPLASTAQADPRAVIRLVDRDQPTEVLPDRPDGLVGKRVSVRGQILRPVALILVSAGFVWLVTVNAWDSDGFMPWFWNLSWMIFPWVFLLPFWGMYVASLRRHRRDRALWEDWDAQRRGARHLRGTILATHHTRTDSGGVASFRMQVDAGGRRVVAGRLAPAGDLLPYELPERGDAVDVFVLPSGHTVVQARRVRALREAPAPGVSSAAVDAAQSHADLAAELERLADLHRAGELTGAEFSAAKTRLLS